MSQEARAIIDNLKAQANPVNVAGMARYGISTQGTLGVPVHALRKLAKLVDRRAVRANHELAAELWASGIHEARILATIVDNPDLVTRSQMNRWARDFDSWDVCDQACQNLFRRTPFAFEKAAEWARARPEFVRRAGFALMAGLAVKAPVNSRDAPDAAFEAWLPLIAEAATDDRNMVKKAVNWALRAIGKRNPRLRRQAVAAAEEIGKLDSRAARWIASDALRELVGQVGNLRRIGNPPGAGG
jgi:3-methyladenine DNA glycosylase AlkD